MLAPMRPSPIMPMRIASPPLPSRLPPPLPVSARGNCPCPKRTGPRSKRHFSPVAQRIRRRPCCCAQALVALEALRQRAKATPFARGNEADVRQNRRRRFCPIQSVRYAPDLRAELRQLLFDRLVTAIDVIDALDVGAPLG